MGFRFRRRITLFPGLRLNVSQSGVSATAGVRGASVTVGKQGVYRNLGIPGTGISHRERISPPPGGSGAKPRPQTPRMGESSPAALLAIGIVIGAILAWIFIA